jgi:hypothetical protein
VEVVMHDARTIGPVRADTVVWRDVKSWRPIDAPADVVTSDHFKLAFENERAEHTMSRADLIAVRATLAATIDERTALKLVLQQERDDHTVSRTEAGVRNLTLTVERDALKEALESLRANCVKRGKELLEMTDALAATRTGMDGAVNLQRVFLANAEVRESRAMREHASVKLDRALLLEQIAHAVSRGHLPSDFHRQLEAWSK